MTRVIGYAMIPLSLQALQLGSLSKFHKNFAISDRYFLIVPDLMGLRVIAWPVATKAAYIAIIYTSPVTDNFITGNISLRIPLMVQH